MPSSPRKTRSSSRLASAACDEDSLDASLTIPDGLPGVSSVPVMKASSMEPVRGRPAGDGKRSRHKMTDLQLQRLEKLYQADTHPSRAAKEALAAEIGMTVKSVLIWFQNRRQDRRRKTSGATSAAASKAVLRRAERALGARTSRRVSAGQENPSVKGKKPAESYTKPAAVTFAAPPFKTRAAHADSIREGSPSSAVSAHTISSDNSCSVNVDRSSPSTAPTSVRQVAKRPARIARSPSSSLESASSDDAATPHVLWKLIVSSPPPPPPVPNAVLHAPHRARQPFGDVQGSRQHKPDLEWACANSAARRKHGYYVYRDEDDSEGESSELEGRSSAQPGPRPIIKRRRRQRQPSSSCGNEWASAVPEEYEKLFPPDLVLGANLLLTLKHSAGPARL